MINKAIFKRCFHYPKKYWYKNLKNIPLYFKSIHFLIKHGYDRYAITDTHNWLIDILGSILKNYLREGYLIPMVIDNFPEDIIDDDLLTDNNSSDLLYDINAEIWKTDISRMIELLDCMDPYSERYNTAEYNSDYEKKFKAINSAKDEFFKLFSTYFYYLWE